MMRVGRRTLVVLVVLVVVGLAGVGEGAVSLEAELRRKEEAVERLARKAEELHEARREVLGKCGSERCSVSGCGERFEGERGFECSEEYGSEEGMCGCKGMSRSKETSTVVLSPTYSDGAEAQAFVCGAGMLEGTFAENARKGGGELTAFQYVGHRTGVLRMFPGAPQGDGVCGSYDPRARPWYAAAATGPKDVVVVFDISTSMEAAFSVFGTETRLDVTVRALHAFLETFTHNDYVSVVGFAREAHVVGGAGHLLQGREENLRRLRPSIGTLRGYGGRDGTHFSVGLGKAFEVLRADGTTAQEGGTTSGCSKLILFLTDGENEESGVDLEQVIEGHQRELEAARGQRARILTYSMGPTALRGAALLKQIACGHGGAWSHIRNGVDPRESLTRYYEFLSAGIDSATVRWSTPYSDALGLGTLVTAARGVYATRGSRRVLVGVAGADVRVAHLQELGGTSVVEELIHRSQECPRLNLTDCQLAHLRHELGDGMVCPDAPATPGGCTVADDDTLKDASPPGMDRVLCDRGEARRSAFADVACCCAGDTGLATPVIVGIAVGASAALVLAVVAIVCYVRRKRLQQRNATAEYPAPSAPYPPSTK